MTLKDHYVGLLLFEHRSFLKAQTSSVAWLPFWVLLEKLLPIGENLRKKNPNGFCVVFVTSVRWEFREVSLLHLGWNFCTIWLIDEAIKFRKESWGGERHMGTLKIHLLLWSPTLRGACLKLGAYGVCWGVCLRSPQWSMNLKGKPEVGSNGPLIFQSTRGIWTWTSCVIVVSHKVSAFLFGGRITRVSDWANVGAESICQWPLIISDL